MAYEMCRDVSEEIWKEFRDREPREITGRTGARYQEGEYHLRFLDRPPQPAQRSAGRALRPGCGGLLAAGKKPGGEIRPAGDAAVALEVFPHLVVEVILWQADEEFPAQATFTLPAHLDAVWGLLNLVTQALLQAAVGESS
jgi:hypothetical protein